MHFVEKIGYITLKSCDQLVGFDVLHLFTNIALNEALSEVVRLLHKDSTLEVRTNSSQ